MLNLQSKFGLKMLAIGNWIAAIVTINLVWFMITLPVLIMLVLLMPGAIVSYTAQRRRTFVAESYTDSVVTQVMVIGSHSKSQ